MRVRLATSSLILLSGLGHSHAQSASLLGGWKSVRGKVSDFLGSRGSTSTGTSTTATTTSTTSKTSTVGNVPVPVVPVHANFEIGGAPAPAPEDAIARHLAKPGTDGGGGGGGPNGGGGDPTGPTCGSTGTELTEDANGSSCTNIEDCTAANGPAIISEDPEFLNNGEIVKYCYTVRAIVAVKNFFHGGSCCCVASAYTFKNNGSPDYTFNEGSDSSTGCNGLKNGNDLEINQEVTYCVEYFTNCECGGKNYTSDEASFGSDAEVPPDNFTTSNPLTKIELGMINLAVDSCTVKLTGPYCPCPTGMGYLEFETIANDDFVSIYQNEVAIINVLENDSSPTGELNDLVVIVNSTNGTTGLVADGSSFEYTPGKDKCGSNDTFVYEVCDGIYDKVCDFATVSVEVLCEDSPNQPSAGAASTPPPSPSPTPLVTAPPVPTTTCSDSLYLEYQNQTSCQDGFDCDTNMNSDINITKTTITENNDTITYCYDVTNDFPQAISHTTLGGTCCCIKATTIQSKPKLAAVKGFDPTTGCEGDKLDTGVSSGVSDQFCVEYQKSCQCGIGYEKNDVLYNSIQSFAEITFKTATINGCPVKVEAPYCPCPAEGLQPPSLVEGRVFRDIDGDGVQDDGEDGIADVSVIVKDRSGTEYTVTTDSNGDYSQEVLAGTATTTIDESDLPETLNAEDRTSEGNSTTLDAISGGTASDLDGYVPKSIVTGRVYSDDNDNGGQGDGEKGLDGVTLIITDVAGNKYTVTTDTDGEYSQTVTAGNTTIAIVESTLPDDTVQSQGTIITVIDAPEGGMASDIDGFAPPGTLYGNIYDDTNNNNTRDGGEDGLAGVEVLVTDSEGVTHTVTTDTNGEYNIQLPVGDATTSINLTTIPAGSDYALSYGGDSTITIPPGESVTDIDAFQAPSSSPSDMPSVSPSASPSDSPSASPSDSPSALPSASPSASPSDSPSASPSDSPSASPSDSPSASPSDSPSASPSDSPSALPSASPSASPSGSPSALPSASPSASPSDSPSASPSDSPSSLPSASPSASPSGSPSALPSASPSASPSDSPSASPSDSPSASPSDSPSASPSGSPSALPSASPSASPSDSPSALPSASPSASPSGSPSALPSASPSASPSESPSASPSDSPSSLPSASPSTSPSGSPSALPSASPSASPSDSPSASPSDSPSASPSESPSALPSASPSASPSGSPSALPSASPSASPSDSPSALPSTSPSESPSGSPSALPSASPSASPSDSPSASPSDSPSSLPSASPSASPSGSPSALPSASPSASPSDSPSASPSDSPSVLPSASPSASPSGSPSALPSASPSASPSDSPSASPSDSPSTLPSASPSASPSGSPSALPSASPSASPSDSPSASPSDSPSSLPSASPSTSPSGSPSALPSASPSASPSDSPSASPSDSPSVLPSASPSASPSGSPSALPSASPSASPSDSPSASPSDSPSTLPSASPSASPSGSPSALPSASPSASPSDSPSASPSDSPSSLPSASPSTSPSGSPSALPSASPSASPSDSPSASPSDSPSASPSDSPSALPSASPSASPSGSPSALPSASPSASPSDSPSASPSDSPSTLPSASPSASPSGSPSALPSASPSASPSDSPSALPSASPSASPSDSPSALPSASPSASPSDSPSASPSDSPSVSPTPAPTPLPTKAPIAPTPAPVVQATTPPVPSSSPSLGPSLSFAPTECKYSEDDLGNLVSCDSNDQCAGFVDPLTNEQLGATCNLATCQCECDPNYCLAIPGGNDQSNVCQYACDCSAQCNINGTKDPAKAAGCTLNCTSCDADPDVCTQDEDCILGKDNTKVCTDSGLCTASKDALCDRVYQVASGSPNNRAKCCPSTSGCIKTTFGVTNTATCGNSCGTSCLGYQSNPGANDGYIPTSFCIFGSRVLNMPYCPIYDGEDSGAASCAGPANCTGKCAESEGNNTICCAKDPVDTALGYDGGLFNCTEESYGVVEGNQTCVDSSRLTCRDGRIIPICEAGSNTGTDTVPAGACNRRRTLRGGLWN